MEPAYILHGSVASPYSMKMRSYMLFKQIHFQFTPPSADMKQFWNRYPGIPKVIPVLKFPDGSYSNDSTFLIQKLEKEFPRRSVFPDDPAMKFLCLLVEDFADEWITKIMYGGRWLGDTKFSGKYVVGCVWNGEEKLKMNGVNMSLSNASKMFEKVQVNRVKKVGCGDWDLLSASAHRVCDAISASNCGFLFGRPSAADFAIFGQFTQFLVDEPVNQILRQYPWTYAWVHSSHDLSGLEIGSWDEKPSDFLLSILRLIGDIYVPFLKANASAYERKAKSFTVSFMQGKFFHTQKPFSYQVKCLKELQTQYGILSPGDRARVSQILKDTGVENIFQVKSRL